MACCALTDLKLSESTKPRRRGRIVVHGKVISKTWRKYLDASQRIENEVGFQEGTFASQKLGARQGMEVWWHVVSTG